MPLGVDSIILRSYSANRLGISSPTVRTHPLCSVLAHMVVELGFQRSGQAALFTCSSHLSLSPSPLTDSCASSLLPRLCVYMMSKCLLVKRTSPCAVCAELGPGVGNCSGPRWCLKRDCKEVRWVRCRMSVAITRLVWGPLSLTPR